MPHPFDTLASVHPLRPAIEPPPHPTVDMGQGVTLTLKPGTAQSITVNSFTRRSHATKTYNMVVATSLAAMDVPPLVRVTHCDCKGFQNSSSNLDKRCCKHADVVLQTVYSRLYDSDNPPVRAPFVVFPATGPIVSDLSDPFDGVS